MATADPDDLDRIDQEIRINELKHEAEELAGGEMTFWESDDCPPEVAESFWQNVVDSEKEPWTSPFEQLTRAGFALPEPAGLDDGQVSALLKDLFARLAEIRTYVTSTDHLSDRQLYERLWGDVLREAMMVMPGGTYHIDMVGGGSEEDIDLHLRYYADEDQRQRWLKSFPDDVLPPREKPPYDRDRHLPNPRYQ